MDSSIRKRDLKRIRRAKRVRAVLRGTSEKPRLSVFRSNRHVFAQLIDDEKGETLASSSTLALKIGKSKQSAATVGTKIAELALAKEVKRVVFDRGRHRYHGLLAELATAAREAGLQF